MGPNFMDDMDCASFFDNMDDLFDNMGDFPEFPLGKDSGNGLVGSGDGGKDVRIILNEGLPDSDNIFSGNSASDLSAEFSLPCEDIKDLEWLSTFVEDSFSAKGMTLGKEFSSVKEISHNQFQTSSPVSVLESSSSSSSSYSGGKVIPLSSNHRGPQRARSKRPRPATFNPRPAMHLISPTSSFTETPQPFMGSGLSSESENYAESGPARKFPKLEATEPKKKKKVKTAAPLYPMDKDQNTAPQTVRKCLHCEITKTPQWRAGPLGPKTLCNACGVRHKSGRLFPEYRPAASPTFVPALHSNSHKKVIEMRNKDGSKITSTVIPATTSQRTVVADIKL